MDLEKLRNQFRTIVYSIVVFIISLLIVRIFLDLIGASPSNIIVAYINEITNLLYNPFLNIVRLQSIQFLRWLNLDAVVAIFVYLLAGLAIVEVITAFMYDKIRDVFINLLDGLFKVTEFLLVIKIILRIFGTENSTTAPYFIQFVYGVTTWSERIVNPIQIIDITIDLSSIIVLIFIIILDNFSERFVISIFETLEVIFKKKPAKEKKA